MVCGRHDHAMARALKAVLPLGRVASTLALAGVILALAGAPAGAQSVTPAPASGGSGLPVPRYVSLKSDRVNVRKGPGTDYPIAWVYQRVGLPVEVVKEFETWRQVRDSEGGVGWVQQNLLSGRRTALVAPWDSKPSTGSDPVPAPTPLHTGASQSSDVLALIEAGVLANVVSCDGGWCRVSFEDQRGYIEQKKLFGVYPDETVR
jgi:SH3-like domain-containing protein